MLFNEIYTPIFEKNKIIQAHQRSVLQLMSVISRNKHKHHINNFNTSAKTDLTLQEKNSSFYTQNTLIFLVKRAGWLVTKIHKHCTFEQSTFKKDFVFMNQIAR